MNGNVTLFISVRKGLESCLLNEIKRNKLLNNINRVHYKKKRDVLIQEDTKGRMNKDDDVFVESLGVVEHEKKWLEKKVDEGLITKVKKSVNLPNSVNERVHCDLNVQPGGIEVKCNWDWLLSGLLSIKSAESIWLRIGNPFRCQNEQQLIDYTSQLPWNLYISSTSIDTIPLRIISRNSTLWSSYIISNCIRKVLRDSFNNSICEKENITLSDSCLSVTLNRNTCYVAIQYSGRLSPRVYNYTGAREAGSNYKTSVPIPYWSLSGLKKSLRSEDSTRVITNLDARDRVDFIKHQSLISEDNYDTADAVLGGFLQNNDLYKNIRGNKLIWDPFCGNGNLLCELYSLLLDLPNFNKEHFKNYIVSDSDCLSNYREVECPQNNCVDLVGSDTSPLMLNEAKLRIRRLKDYYKDISNYKGVRASEGRSKFTSSSTLFKSFPGFPVSITLHKSSIETLSQFMSEALIVTKIPYNKGPDSCNRIKLYKTIGQIIGSRPDWRAVYVISRKRGFEYYSGLEWKTISKCNNSKGDSIKLLKWTGRSRQFKLVEDRIAQLDDLDLL